MAPLTRLELRRAAAEPILLRLLCSSALLFFLRLPPPLLAPSPFLPSTTRSFEFEVRGGIVLLDFQIPISVVAPSLEYEVLVGFKSLPPLSLFFSLLLFICPFFYTRISFYYANRIKRNAPRYTNRQFFVPLT